jgi:signal transduction histidine kinase
MTLPRLHRSLSAKFLVLSIALVVTPGLLFAVITFSSTRRSLEEAVGVQLAQAAEEGAGAFEAILERVTQDAAAWAGQDVMREILIEDVDKRVSKFLVGAKSSSEAYAGILCSDNGGRVVAASDGAWLGRNVSEWRSFRQAMAGAVAISGPLSASDGDDPVVEVASPIRNPDASQQNIGVLFLLLDWKQARSVVERIREKLRRLKKDVAVLVVDAEGQVIGDTLGAQPLSGVAREIQSRRWKLPAGFAYGQWPPNGLEAGSPAFLVGSASLSNRQLGWSVLVVEPVEAALAPIAEMRRRWVGVLAVVLLGGLALAAILAGRMSRPLRELRDATKELAAHPATPAPVPVRSQDEIGQLAEAFNTMVNDLKRAQEQLLSAAKFAFAGELAASVAHEVRTPLSVMRSSAQMLLNAPSVRAGENAELVEMLIGEVDRVERVVTGLLELAKPQPHRMERATLPDILVRAIDFVQAQAARQDVTIESDFAPSLPAVTCDREQIYQVALNLLVNALQALSGGGRIMVRTLTDQTGMVRFEVEDDGPGIASELRERIFQPFVTGREGGTGLGLALVRRIVEEHGGSIEVQSSPGKGAAFSVRLRRYEGAS